MSALSTKRNFSFRNCIVILAILFSSFQNKAYSQLVVNGAVTQAQLMAALVGQGLTITNVTMNCPTGAWGTFNGVSSNIGMNNGVLLTTGSVNNAVGPNFSPSTGTNNNTTVNDPQLTAIEPFAIYDVCILEFDIVAQCNNLQIRFVFGSEEYPEFVSSGFNDAFGFFISGPGPSPSCTPNFYNNTNVATLPDNVTIVSIDNVNNITNNTYYFDNTGGATVQYDGFTTTLTRNVSLCPCQTYHFKIAIGDAGDHIYDSGVFLDFIQCGTALSATSSSTAAGCTCVGTATAVGANSTGPYTYSWAPSGQTNAIATGLCAGTYTCFVDDQVSCSAPVQTIVTVSGINISATVAPTNVSCNGGSNGSATATPSGGTSPYTYVWAPSGGTNQTATGLAPGTYTVTVTDANGCTTTQTVTITQPTAVAGSMASTNPTCFGGTNGSATVTASGGTPGYTYNWAPSGGTGATGTGLSAGTTYTVTITDANGCSTTQTATLTQPTQVTASTGSIINPTCGNNNGSATATGGGGTPGYTYSWAPTGGTNATATGLGSGTYTVYVTDANGCSQNSTVNIPNSSGLGSSITSTTNILCNGGLTGSATVTGTAGTSPYTYVWSPSGQTNATATGLGAGTYTVTVTDAAGCTSTQTVTLTQPTAVVVTHNQNNVACNGNSTGSAIANVTGGTPSYTYLWAPSGGTNATETGLAAGTYTVTVTDANGCTTTHTVTITQPTVLSTSIGSIVNSVCGNPNGSMTATATGGTGPYSYSWAPSGGTNANATGLGVGTYTVYITDAIGCTSTATAVITTSGAISLTTAGAQTICIGQSATLTATATGGTSPYTYSWAPNSSTSSSVSVNPTTTTTYSVWVTDANGCMGGPQTVTVIVNPALGLTLTASPTSICIGGNATITTNATGGNGSYSYVWAPSGSGTSTTVSPTTTTTYTVTVNDNCGTPVATTTVTIVVNPSPTACLSVSDTAGCSPMCVTYTNCGTGTSWNWSFPGGTPSTSTVQNPTVCYNAPGLYSASVTTTSSLGCTAATTMNNIVHVYGAPTAAFTQAITSGVGLPATVCYTNTSTGSVSWLWTSGTNTATTQNTCFTYPDTGNYCTTLIATNAGGCADTVTHCIEIVDDTFNLQIPNVFSPNGDGHNDVFTLTHIGVKELALHIYNRWGSLIFSGDVLTTGWDGRAPGGGTASDGTYYYVVIGLRNNGEAIEEKGFVTLLSKK